MRKCKLALCAIPFGALLLTSCAEAMTLDKYISTLDLFNGKDQVSVLHLSDIHWSINTNYKVESAYLTKVKDAAVAQSGGNLGLIMVTGDLFLTANQTTVTTLFNLFDSWDIPWGFVYGNHDLQGTYGPDYVDQMAASAKNCVYHPLNDTVSGRSNYVVNITDETGATKWQIYGIDSNSLYPQPMSYSYDVIHDDEIKWFKEETALAKANNGDVAVPNLTFFHIPLFQTEYAYKMRNDAGNTFTHGGEMYDKVYGSAPEGLEGTRTYPGYKDSGFFQVAQDNGTKGIFNGHDHSNNFYSEYTADAAKDPVLLAYCVKSGRGLDWHTYKDGEAIPTGLSVGDDMVGGNLITIHKDGSFAAASDFKNLFVQYDK